MCGFAGFIDFEAQRYKDFQRLQILTAMGRQLARRGPNDEQSFDDGRLSFVFRRLSIVDLENGQQPIWNEDRTLFAAINGEIYNHQELRSKLRVTHHFKTQSDAEVVLHLFEEQGPEALQSLNGMFAIAIWDTLRHRLFLARDRLGIKPLYFCQQGSQLIFGSELKALLVHPDCPTEPKWSDLAVFTTTSSYVKEVYCLPGGHYLTYDATQALSPQCYWSIRDYFVSPSDQPQCKAEDYIVGYCELFADSVKKQLMSDVPIATFLSGGVDSSAIAAVAADSLPNLHCFTVLEKSTYLTGDAESARNIAQLLGLPLHSVFFDHNQLVEQLDFSLANFEYFIWLIDSPRFHLEWFFKHELHRYAKTIIPDLKVILLGQGADEFTGGYSARMGGLQAESWEAYLTDELQPELKEFFAKRQIPLSWSSLFQSKNQEPETFRERSPEKAHDFKPKTPALSVFHQEMLRRVVMLQEYNLWHEDRSAASQGMESRVPFLDHRLVEFLAAIPPEHHAELFWNKAIIRKMSQKWLPASFLKQPKAAFFMSASDQSSIVNLTYRLLLKIFPEFREKYLETVEQKLFSKSRLVELFEQLNQNYPTNTEVMNKLLNCMAMVVFEDLCQTLSKERTLDSLDCPSPLYELSQSSVRDQLLWNL
jgi:asparagine synthase (glutamine-hydrolysing)